MPFNATSQTLLGQFRNAARAADEVRRLALGSAAPLVEASLALKQAQPLMRQVMGSQEPMLRQAGSALKQVQLSLRSPGLLEAAKAAQEAQSVFRRHAPAIAGVVRDIRRQITPVSEQMQAIGQHVSAVFDWVHRMPALRILRSPFDHALMNAAWADEEDPWSREVDQFLLTWFSGLISNANDLAFARYRFTSDVAPRCRDGSYLTMVEVHGSLAWTVSQGRKRFRYSPPPLSLEQVSLLPAADESFRLLECRVLVEQYLNTHPELTPGQRAAMLDLVLGECDTWADALRRNGVTTEAERKQIQRVAKGMRFWLDARKKTDRRLH